MDHDQPLRRVVVGVDTHKHAHVAVALDERGTKLGTGSFAADRSGYAQLIAWATSFGAPITTRRTGRWWSMLVIGAAPSSLG